MNRHNFTANVPEVNLSCRLEQSFWQGPVLRLNLSDLQHRLQMLGRVLYGANYR